MARLLVCFELAATVLIVPQRHAGASNDDLYIEEVMAGANGDSRIQFIVIKQEVAGANLWGPQGAELESRAMLVFFDARGRETGRFKFPANPPTGGTLKTLIATSEFADLPAAPAPDMLIPPLLSSLGGKVCFRNNPSNASATLINECVSYGSFTGDTEINRSGEGDPGIAAGPPAPPLPIMNTISIRRTQNTRRNSDFFATAEPNPINTSGTTLTIPVAAIVRQGETLFGNETFSGNGRTCASCHVAADSFGLSPRDVQSRFAAPGAPESSFDPLFIGEPDFNLNTLVLAEEVATPAPCTGDLRGLITASNGGRAKVLARTGPTTYLIYGGIRPALAGTVTDGTCSATVARVSAGDLAAATNSSVLGLENPVYLRGATDPKFPDGRALILENIDGYSNPPVFRRSPHLLNLSQTAPYGFNGDVPDLRAFSTNAVVQHFPRTLGRNGEGPNPDFRLPVPEELAALEAFLLAQEFPPGNDPNKFDLARFATTEIQKRGMEEFVVFGCAACHGGPTLSQTTIAIQDQPAGVNASFSTGTTENVSAGSLPCEPSTESIGRCGSRRFSTPQLFNLPNLGPFFHNGSARTVAEAVNFYNSSEFGTSPANIALINQGVGVVATDAITLFLEGLVARPYTLSKGPLRFGARGLNAGPSPVRAVTITNTSSTGIRFDSAPCRLTGTHADAFAITDCPLSTPLAPGESRRVLVVFDPGGEGLKSAILEVHPVGTAPAGIDLFGVGGSLGPPPELMEISEVSGPSSGGHALVLTGAHFANGATVTIGAVEAGFIDFLSSTQISVRTGAHVPGTVGITVVNPDGQIAALPNAYTYVAPAGR